MNMQNSLPNFFVGVAGILFCAIIVIVGIAYEPNVSPEKHVRKLAIEPALIEARAAVLYAPDTGEILFEKRAEEQLPLASLTKLLTAYLALEGDVPERVTIASRDLTPEGDSGLSPGESWALPDLVSFALVTSSNDAIAAAARAAGVKQENLSQAIGELALRQTFAMNPTGLDFSSTTAGAYGSALDVARLFSFLLAKHRDVVEPTASPATLFENLSGKAYRATSTGRSLADVPGLRALKTGFTDLAGGNLAVVFDRDIGRPLVAVVLGSSVEGRFKDIRTIIEAVHESDL